MDNLPVALAPVAIVPVALPGAAAISAVPGMPGGVNGSEPAGGDFGAMLALKLLEELGVVDPETLLTGNLPQSESGILPVAPAADAADTGGDKAMPAQFDLSALPDLVAVPPGLALPPPAVGAVAAGRGLVKNPAQLVAATAEPRVLRDTGAVRTPGEDRAEAARVAAGEAARATAGETAKAAAREAARAVAGEAARAVAGETAKAAAREAANFAAPGQFLPSAAAEKASAQAASVLLSHPEGGEQHARQVSDSMPAPQAAASAMISAAAPAQVAAPAHALKLDAAVGAPGWHNELGQKVVWMVTQQQQVAELHLNPPSLGPVEVMITVSNDQATAVFVSQHAAVREAIETAMPRLREMMADSGITLGNATVSADSFQQSGSGREQRTPATLAASLQAGRPEWRNAVIGRSGDGLVDTFA